VIFGVFLKISPKFGCFNPPKKHYCFPIMKKKSPFGENSLPQNKKNAGWECFFNLIIMIVIPNST
jgi:hypothetical protein